MDKKLYALIGGNAILLTLLFTNSAMADQLSAGSKWDGFLDCHTSAGNPILLCVGFNTIHQDDGDIKTLLASEITNQNTIIDQNKQIIQLLTPKQNSTIPHLLNEPKCYPSGTGKICDP